MLAVKNENLSEISLRKLEEALQAGDRQSTLEPPASSNSRV